MSHYSGSVPDTLARPLSWTDRAACRGEDLELFFRESKTGIAYAKRICRGCPVREECLAEAMRVESGSRYGIYGGLTEEERTILAGGGSKTGRKPAQCGTRSAYQRHLLKGEPIDEACRAAKRESDRLLRATGSTRARP